MEKLKMRRIVLLALAVGLVVGVLYNIFDNQRFRIVEDEIFIERLPAAFDGFCILQISDLHGKYFGEKQGWLLNAINKLDYDMIAFTGDMNPSDTWGNTLEDSGALLDLLDGIEQREQMVWVDGNAGPYAVESYCGSYTGALTAVGASLQEKGVKILVAPVTIERQDEKIWITPALSELRFDSNYRSLPDDGSWECGKGHYERVQAYYGDVYPIFRALQGNDEVKILLDHYPQQRQLPTGVPEMMGSLDYDLILAGHYHGGQWRLPLIGAVYIPSPTEGINHTGLFPAQAAVKGWSSHNGIPQYISAGLGSSSHAAGMNFRLFNTPEINVITLRSGSLK
jgi:uncharacterized protein